MKLLESVGRKSVTRSSSSVEQRFTFGDIQNLIHNGQSYIVGARGSKPDDVDGTFASRISQIHRRHGTIAAAVETRALLMSQVRFQWRRPDGTLFGDRTLAPLERPGSMTRVEFLARLEYDVSYSGTAVVGRRGGRLFRLPPDRVRFLLGSDSSPEWDGDVMIPPYDTQVVAVTYDPGLSRSGVQGQVEAFLPGDFATWSPEPDPIHFWRGESWVTSVVREALLDGQVTDHQAKFFENAANPGLVFLMDPQRTAVEVEQYRDIINDNHSGVGQHFKNMFLGGATDVKVVGSSLDSLNLGHLQGTFENRVAVRSRVPAVVLGTKESLSGSSLNAGNYAAARRVLSDGWFTPTVDGLCASLESLIPAPTGGVELAYDPSRVLFLQEDQKDAADILSTNAAALRQLVEAGYDPATAVAAVKSGDISQLTHTGNVSVQLQPPGAA